MTAKPEIGPAPEIVRTGLLDLQVCVPAGWPDEQVRRFAEGEWPCGTENGWQIRREGSRYLAGDPERQPCAKRAGYVHIMLDA